MAMFSHDDAHPGTGVALAIGGLALVSMSGLVITGWSLIDFSYEQAVLDRLIQHLPPDDVASVQKLAGELRLQGRLAILVVLDAIATGIAFVLLGRAYVTSERSLRTVKVFAGDILDSMNHGVLTIDQDSRVTSINRHGRALLAGQGEILGRPLAEVAPAEIHSLISSDANGSSLGNGHSSADRNRMVLVDGARRTFRTSQSRLRNERREEVGTVIQLDDVTEQFRLEQQLRRMERYMGLGSLAAGLHHEIKNPLSGFALHLKLLEEALEEEGAATEQTDEILEVLRRETVRITSVLDSFKGYASLDDLNRSEVDARRIVMDLARSIRPRAGQQEVVVLVRRAREAVPPVLADPVRLEQVLWNLAENALDAMPQGGTLSLGVSRGPRDVEIRVSDTGGGIPTEVQEQLFDPYFTTRREGTGMGLPLCEKIVRQHNGTIEFQTGSQGTEFTIALPTDEG